MYKLIGISGTNGAGKDTVGQLLVERHNFVFVSVTDILRESLVAQGLPTDRDNMRWLSAKWRREEGLGVLVDKAIAVYESSAGKYAGLAMASLRNPGEADEIHQQGGTMLWVDANPKLRYERLQRNLAARGREDDDEVSYQKFLADEAEEMYVPAGGDTAMLSMSEVKAKSDVFISNEDQSLDQLDTKLISELGL